MNGCAFVCLNTHAHMDAGLSVCLSYRQACMYLAMFHMKTDVALQRSVDVFCLARQPVFERCLLAPEASRISEPDSGHFQGDTGACRHRRALLSSGVPQPWSD